MLRKLLVVTAAVAMPVTLVAATGAVAGAGAPKVDATHYTVTCTGITATAKFNPPLTNAGGASSNEATTIKGSLSGCTVAPTEGGTAVTVTGAKISGTINDATSTHTCAGLASPTTESGSLTIKWKTSPKLTDSSSVSTPSTVTGGIGADGNATFSIAYSGVTGPFEGTDGGASSTSNAETTESLATIGVACGGKGLKSVGIEANGNPGAGAAAFLG